MAAPVLRCTIEAACIARRSDAVQGSEQPISPIMPAPNIGAADAHFDCIDHVGRHCIDAPVADIRRQKYINILATTHDDLYARPLGNVPKPGRVGLHAMI